MPGLKIRLVIAVVCLALFAGLRPNEKANERPRTPWATRSVLDLKPRMLTLALDSAMFIAYDLSTASLYKVWKGGLSLDGAVYTSKKDIQPTSWGTPYFIDTTASYKWRAQKAGKDLPAKIENKGYLFRNGQIFLKHILILNKIDTVLIEERPEFVRNTKGKPGLERLFNVNKAPESVQLSIVTKNTSFEINKNGGTKWAIFYDELPTQYPPKSNTESLSPYKAVLQKTDCLICHEIDEPAVGPSFRQIAGRYPKEKTAVNYLLNKVKQGGTGAWGNGVMNPHPLLTDMEITTVLDYIFTLKPKIPVAETSHSGGISIQKIRPVKPGYGAALEGVHPSYDLTTLHNENFRPKVGAMAFMPDGRLLVTTWDTIGGVYVVDGLKSGDSGPIRPRLIASGLAEPLGIEVVDGEIYVLQKQELTKLIDLDKDGIIDEYRAVCNTWQVSADFHEFAFGLVYKDGYFYVSLSMAMRLKPGEIQLKDRGRVIRIAKDGTYQSVNYGLRTPNGIGLGIDNEIFVTDNQGQWLPGNKLIHVQEGQYLGMGWGLLSSKTTPKVSPPAIWLPQNEIGNSPTEPVLMPDGPYKGQMLHGDMGHGGIKRDFLEKIKGQYQGAVFRFSQGFEAGVNRLRWGPDGALYVGQIGMMGGGWSWKDKLYGLQKIKYNGKATFEMLAIRAKSKGFEIEFTQPVKNNPDLSELTIQQWWYEPTPAYGGPKKDLTDLKVSKMEISKDRKRIYLEIPGLEKGHVVYFRLPDDLKTEGESPLWSSEAWYTLNEIPF
jgi:cytochrome c